jgi:O-antigen ligase
MINLNKKNLFEIPNTAGSIVAMLLSIPTYMIILLGTDIITQGAAYMAYTLMLPTLFFYRFKIMITKQLTIFGLVFYAAWLIPNFYLISTGSLESYLISVPVLLFHAVVLFVTIICLFRFQAASTSKSNNDFFKTWFVFLCPLLLLMMFEIFKVFLNEPDKRTEVFGYSHLNGEVLLIGLFLSYYLKNIGFKVVITGLILLCLIAIQVRTGLLAALLFLIAINFRYLQTLSARKLILTLLLIPFLFFLWDYLWAVIDYIFLISNKGRGIDSGLSSRIPIWHVAWNEIANHPWTGIGFFVRPNPWIDPNNVNLHVHNAFLRLWVENGTALFTLVMFVIMGAVYQIYQKRLLWDGAVLLSICFYYFFYPRHLTLNPMSIMLYLVLVRAFVLKTFTNKIMSPKFLEKRS